ncbi:PKD domain-containing protein [Altererythrobacter sp. GH1-8]|uniref:PKD domain-containing protein n=1 Tax=Altererythrobacter sp. GH1-8 TaxID=3349333 RepID=UPI00374D627D
MQQRAKDVLSPARQKILPERVWLRHLAAGRNAVPCHQTASLVVVLRHAARCKFNARDFSSILRPPSGNNITIPGNIGPTANAGPDASVGGGTTGSLDCTGSSDGDGDPITYQWTQLSGPAVTLTGATTATPSFTAPAASTAPQTLVFQLVVDDGLIASAADTVTITIPDNAAPTVNAGPDATVAAGSNVTLSGSANDLENDPLTYQWTQTSGPAVTLAGATTLTPSFTAPARTASAQVLTFILTANDGNSTSTGDTVNITVPANQAPTAAISGPATASGSATILLDGSGSTDPDGDPLIYQWTQVSGPAATIADPGAATTNVVLPTATNSVQTVVFQLFVADSFDASDAEQITIQIAANNAPVADAGPDATVGGDAQVTLNGSGSSDSDNDPITYSWTQVSGPPVTLSDPAAANPTFTSPARRNGIQELGFQLVVNDGNASSAPDLVTITVESNTLPVPDAGPDQTVQGNSTVTLDASGTTDADGDAISYTWTQVSGPTVTLSDASLAQPTFTAPASNGSTQTLVFRVFVSDGITNGLEGLPSDTVVITVAANAPPVANAGIDQGPIDSGSTVTLDGTASTDPDGDPLFYTWTQVSGPTVTLSDPGSASPSFTAPNVQGLEDLVFSLTVSDGQVTSESDTVTVGVRGVGTVTIVQRVIGSDASFAFTSDIAALNGTIATSGGTGQLSATSVAAGSYSVSVSDLASSGLALTDISCNDSDSVVDLSSRSVALALAPNENLVCIFTSASAREAAISAINNFLTGRNALIMSMQPDLQRRLDRLQESPGSGASATAYGMPVPGSGSLPIALSLASGQSRLSTSLATLAAAAGDPDRGRQPLDIWAEAYFADARLGQQDGSFRIIHTGIDYRVNESLLLGVLGQFDHFSNDGPLEEGEADGNGWMVGPYVMTRLAPQLFGEVRATWGKSENRVSPLGTYADAFDTKRSLYSGSLVGQFDIGQSIQIRPEFTLRYMSEKALAYTDSLNIAIPGQRVDQGDLSFRPRVHKAIVLQSGWTLRPFAEIEGIYTFGTGTNAVLDDGLRARIEGGLDLFGQGSFRSSLSAFHDGIGSSSLRSSGVHVAVSFGF